jgi:hypothetical protein
LKGGQGGASKFGFLLYFVPFVAIAYDLYIFAENFKVKRIGAFLKERYPGMRAAWETWVSEHRETLAFYGGSFALTMFSLLTEVGLVAYSDGEALPRIVTVIWFVLALFVAVIIFVHAKRLEKDFDKPHNKPEGEGVEHR